MSEPFIDADLIVEGAAEVVTCAGVSQDEVGAIPGGVVACAGERIVFVGSADECCARVRLAPTGRRIDAQGGAVLPGFVDAHTHLPFAGWRDAELEMRLAGASYVEIAGAGGGILSTVRETRAASDDELLSLVRGRLDAMILCGTTTAEAKSGYGLSLESELRLLETLARASDHPIELVPTFLGAHVVGPEFQGDDRRNEGGEGGRGGGRDEYVRLIVEEMIPRVAERGLARFCDVFIDRGAFTLDEGRRILEAARAHGLGLRVHAEQITRTGAAALAASLGAFSVDHLEQATAEDVAVLAATWTSTDASRSERIARARGLGPNVGAPVPRSGSSAGGSNAGTAGPQQGTIPGDLVGGTAIRPGGAEFLAVRRRKRGAVALLLPGASFFLRETSRPPARALIDAGVPVALATDFNPGTSPCHAMPPILNLACLLFGLTPDEAIVAATRQAALSLGLEARVGTLEAGKQADLAVWAVPGRRHLAYRFGPVPCRTVIKRGRIVVEDSRLVGQDMPGDPVGGTMLVDLTLKEFEEKLASESPTPGGGSVSALAGAQGAALLEMVIAVTLKGEKYAASRPKLEPIRTKASSLRRDFRLLVDRDAEAYESVVAAMRLPKESVEEKAARKAARDRALLFAAEVPLRTAELAAALAALAEDAAPHVNPNVASDLLVAALLAEAALGGAAANVRINIGALKSEDFAAKANARLKTWTTGTAARIEALRARFPSIA